MTTTLEDNELARLYRALWDDDATMTGAELEAVRGHFAEMARLMLIAGPIFASPRYQAMKLHDRAVANGRGVNPARQREREREEERLLPIE
jgi:hypothetical protein